MRPAQRGFNLVEVMAALFVLSVALFAVLSVNAYTLKLNSSNQKIQTANTIASTQLSIVESVLKSDFHAPTEAVGTQVFGSADFPDFTFQVLDDGYEDPSRFLRSVTVRVFWGSESAPKVYELSTTFYNY